MEKGYERIRASTFLKVLFGDKLHDEVDGVEVSKHTKLLLWPEMETTPAHGDVVFDKEIRQGYSPLSCFPDSPSICFSLQIK